VIRFAAGGTLNLRDSFFTVEGVKPKTGVGAKVKIGVEAKPGVETGVGIETGPGPSPIHYSLVSKEAI
jgi:hypothetical protein